MNTKIFFMAGKQGFIEQPNCERNSLEKQPRNKNHNTQTTKVVSGKQCTFYCYLS